MAKTPTKSEILEKAVELFHNDRFRNGDPSFAITPTEQELRENGYISIAVSGLLRDSVRANLEGWKSYANAENFGDSEQQLDYKSLIEKVCEHGDLVVLGQKGTCKTTLMMHLARTLRADRNNRVIIFETFPKWIHEFDSIPYMVIADSDVQPKENLPYLQEDKSYIQWSKDYTILNANEVLEFLKLNKDVVFLIECEDMEKISAFMTFVIYTVYRKQYQRAYYGRLDRTAERFWFLCEEAHNLLDSTTVQKKTFQKLRKIQNEFRNLNMHMICIALRLQDLNPKIRSKMAIVLGKVSLDDYQLKVRALLRNSKYKDAITQLPKGTFVFPETDQTLTTEPFKQNGKPLEWFGSLTVPILEIKRKKQSFFRRLFGDNTEHSFEVQVT